MIGMYINIVATYIDISNMNGSSRERAPNYLFIRLNIL